MAGVTPEGYTAKDLETVRTEINDDLRELIDPGLTLTDQDPLGQLVAVLSGSIAEVWEVTQAVYDSQYPDSASGSSLDNVAALTGTLRAPETKTLVTARVTMNPNKALPAGSVANLSGQPNARFLTLAEVPADSGGGVFDVDMEAENAGFVAVPVNQLTEIAEPVSGWVAVDNVAGATFQGTDTQTDSQLRIKRIAELAAGGSTNVDAIRANVIQVSGVIDAAVTEDLDNHTITVVVLGGTAPDVAAEIFRSRAAGIGTEGSLVEVVNDSQGFPHTIRLDFAAQQNFFADMVVVINPLVFDPVDGPSDIKEAISDYVNGLRIGQDVIYDRVKCAVFEVAGISLIASLDIGFDVADQTIDLPVAPNEKPVSDVANIAVATT